MQFCLLFSVFCNIFLILFLIIEFKSFQHLLGKEIRALNILKYYEHQISYFNNELYCHSNDPSLNQLFEKRQNTKILLAIKSGGKKGFQRREMMRNTTLRKLRQLYDKESIDFFFVLSKHEDQTFQEKIEIEMKLEKDIVLFYDLIEQYRLL